jgi:catechol 2,3-dioxygenase-like lactoylglutathione lyase family enzyme
MTVRSVDIGFVSTDRSLVDFLAAVFELSELDPLEFPQGTVYRLAGPGGLVKVMVPATPPRPLVRSDPFHAIAGLRYLTVRVDDLDGVLERATVRGASIALGPLDLRPGVRLAVLTDPDGNAIEVIED